MMLIVIINGGLISYKEQEYIKQRDNSCREKERTMESRDIILYSKHCGL